MVINETTTVVFKPVALASVMICEHSFRVSVVGVGSETILMYIMDVKIVFPETVFHIYNENKL